MVSDENKNEEKDSKEESILTSDLSQVASVCSLDLAAIIIQLHFNAAKKAEAKNNAIQIINTAVDGKDEKSANFNGAGTNYIVAISNKQDEKITASDTLPVIQEYIQWFAGPDVAKEVTVDKLFSLGDGSDKQTENKQEKDQQQTESFVLMPSFQRFLLNEKANISVSNAPTDNQASTDDTNKEENKEASKEETKEETKEEQQDTSEEDQSQSTLGWQVAYKLIIKGKPEHSAAQALKSLGNTLKGLIKSLGVASFDWRSGKVGEVTTIGDVTDSIFGKMDSKQLEANFTKNLQTKFPQSDVTASIYDTPTIIKNLGKNLASSDKSKIKAANLALCVKVDKSDESYKLFNQQVIVDLITQGMSKKFKNKIKAEDVILVNGREGRAEVKSGGAKAEDSGNSENKENKKEEEKTAEATNDSQILTYSTVKLIAESILKNYVKNINGKNYLEEDNNTSKLMHQIFEDVVIKENQADELKGPAIELLIKNLDVLRTDDNLDKYFDEIYVNPETKKKYSFTDKNEKKYSSSGYKELYSILTDKSLDKVKAEEKLNAIKNSNPTIWKKITKQSIGSFISKAKEPEKDNKEPEEDNAIIEKDKPSYDFYIIPMKGLKSGSGSSEAKEG